MTVHSPPGKAQKAAPDPTERPMQPSIRAIVILTHRGSAINSCRVPEHGPRVAENQRL